jgi:hypothetical protein
MKDCKTSYQLELRRRTGAAGFLPTLARIGLVLTFLAVGAHAQTYNAATGFSTKTNTDTSLWSYRYNTTGTRDGNYTLLPYVERWGYQWYNDQGEKIVKFGWFAQPSNGTYPGICANKRATPITTYYGSHRIVLPKRSIFEHPSTISTVGDTVLSFLVPTSGTVTVKFRFTDIDPYGGNGINWYVDLNSEINGDLYSGRVHSHSGHIATTGTRSFQIAVVEGDRLNFVIDSDGEFHYDSTAVKAIVAY